MSETQKVQHVIEKKAERDATNAADKFVSELMRNVGQSSFSSTYEALAEKTSLTEDQIREVVKSMSAIVKEKAYNKSIDESLASVSSMLAFIERGMAED